MSKPVSPRPLRKAAAICAYSQDDPPLRNLMRAILPDCCARRERPRHRRAAEEYDELASPHGSPLWAGAADY
jgi:hypothetical protein